MFREYASHIRRGSGAEGGPGRKRERATSLEARNSGSLFVCHLLAWEYGKGKGETYVRQKAMDMGVVCGGSRCGLYTPVFTIR